MSLESIMAGDRRLVILQALEAAGGYALRESVLQRTIEAQTASVSRDRLRTDLDWLAEQELLAVERGPAHWLATITPRGVDVAKGRAIASGVDRPLPGGA